MHAEVTSGFRLRSGPRKHSDTCAGQRCGGSFDPLRKGVQDVVNCKPYKVSLPHMRPSGEKRGS